MAHHSSPGLVSIQQRALDRVEHNNQSVEYVPNTAENLRTMNDGRALNRSHDNIGAKGSYIVTSSKMLNGSLKRIVAE